MQGWDVDIAGYNGSFHLQASFRTTFGTSVLVGHNGAGKSTLLKMLVGALQPEHGHLHLNGHVLFDSSKGINLPPEDRGIGYVPQGYGLFPHMTALSNVSFGLLGRFSKTERHKRARQYLASINAEHLAERYPDELSGGEQQRIALARALVVEPLGLLLDEPMAALDATARRATRKFLVKHLSALDCPTLVVTHSRRDVVSFSEQVVVLEKGRVVQTGDLDQLTQAPATPFVEDFFHPEG